MLARYPARCTAAYKWEKPTVHELLHEDEFGQSLCLVDLRRKRVGWLTNN